MEQSKSCHSHSRHHLLLLVLLILVVIFAFSCDASPPTYNVVSYGARGDGNTDSSKAFSSAWKMACGSPEGATVYVPQGRYLINGKLSLSGQQCKNKAITIRIDGTLLAPSDYRVIGSGGNWIVFESVDGVSVYGGTLDAQGAALWACKDSGKDCPTGATTLQFSNSNNIKVCGLSSLNSQMFHMVIHGCTNVMLQRLKISASGESPNTDGIHIASSTGVSVLNTKISTGDDCISIGPGARDLWIENIACGPGHGISIGSLGWDKKEDGVWNVTVKTVIFRGTQNGVRIKTWGRPSSGYVNHVLYQHITMVNVENPVIINQNYCPDHKGCPNQDSGVRISDVTYQDIHGSSATEVALKFDCSKKNRCSGLRLQDVNLSYENRQAEASCANAEGTASGIIVPSSCL